MSDDIQTFFEGARLSQKKFHNTNQVHTQYIHLHSDSKIGTYFLAVWEVSSINYLEITWKIYIFYDSFTPPYDDIKVQRKNINYWNESYSC